ncbi:TPR-like protein [Melanogaster broomeanus]|nr:TPR-like protein [Melanogaster broomeanus]
MVDTTRHPSDSSVPSSLQANPAAEDVQDLGSVEQRLGKANELKLEGNELFKASKWSEALVSYRTALNQLPPRKRLAEQDIDPPTLMQTQTKSNHQLDIECSKTRAVLVCQHWCMSTEARVVDACTQALNDDAHYVKALQRRAASNEKIGTWTSLSRAQEDYKLLVELLPANSPELSRTKKALQLIEPRMMDKLKGLGNTILGKFGLSTDNFKFEPNGQGGYSMNFTQ